MKKYAIIGFGGLGKTHFINLIKLQEERKDIELVAICNSDIESITKSITINLGLVDITDFDFSDYRLYTDYKYMVEKEDLDFVIIALPTYLHAEVGIYCLEHGINVYTEKPMAINLEQCKALMEAAKKNNKKLMVGQSLRFETETIMLKNAIKKNTYGKVVKAEFFRKSPLPTWSFENWLLNDDLSGSCIVDMHVHDVDIMVHLFGKPDSFNIESTHHKAPYECSYCTYRYPDSAVTITTDWGLPATFKFTQGYRITFENAYIESTDGEATLYTEEKKEKLHLEPRNNLYDEMVEWVAHVVDDEPLKTVSIDSVYETMKLVFAEKKLAVKHTVKENKEK